MSKARSPREVCSTTIGMFGLIKCSFRERVLYWSLVAVKRWYTDSGQKHTV